MAELHLQESINPEYSQGYSADVDIIRGQEYPLLNGTNVLCLSPHTLC